MRTIQTEFPEFPAMPEAAALLAAGWLDQSWHNDTCPRFVSADGGWCMFVDHPEPTHREDPEAGRFTVCAMDGEHISDCLYHGDDWQAACTAAEIVAP